MNNHLHPLFQALLETAMDKTPCRVSGELSAHQADEARAALEFVPFDDTSDEDIQAVVPVELQEPMHKLLMLRRQIQMYERIGPLNKHKVVEEFKTVSDEILTALKARWADL